MNGHPVGPPPRQLATAVSRRVVVRGLVAGAALLAAPARSTTVAAASGPRVRFVNAAPGAPALDVLVAGEPAAEGLRFGKASKTAAQPAATFELRVTPAGQGPDDAVARRRLRLKADLVYHVAILGEYPAVEVQAFAVVARPLEAGQARLRLVHLAPDLDAVDCRVGRGAARFRDVRYPGATDYTAVAAGPLDLELIRTAARDRVLVLRDVELTEGRAHDLFLIGRVADDSLDTLMLTAAARRATGEAAGPPTTAELAYLRDLATKRELVRTSLTSVEEVLQDPQPDLARLNQLAWVFLGWIVAERGVRDTPPPARYDELRSAYLAALEPLGTVARRMSNAEDYLDDRAESFEFVDLDLAAVGEAVARAIPLLEDAAVRLDEALKEGGLPTG